MSNRNFKGKRINIHSCRICLDAKCNDTVVIDEQNGWLKLFEYCFGFALTVQDEPRILCKLCADEVQKYSGFKEKCLKSDNLWKSVITDVKCRTNKIFLDVEVINDCKNINESTYPMNSEIQIKDESGDRFSDNGFNDDETIDIFPTEIKVENTGNDVSPTDFEDNNTYINKSIKKEGLTRNKIDSKQKHVKNEYSTRSAKAKKSEVYTCKKCKKNYVKKKVFFKHVLTCQNRKRRTECHDMTIHPDKYAYDCGRDYSKASVPRVGTDVSSIKIECQSDKSIEKDINENQNQDGSLLFCGVCKLTFENSIKLYKHLNEHWSNNDLACTLCDFVGIDSAALAAHRFFHYQSLYKQKDCFICHICEKMHVSLLSLHFHYRMEHLNKKGGFCSRCNKEFTKSRVWKKHEKTHCAPVFMCDICGRGFWFKYQIKEHVILHSKPSRYICDACGKTFSRESNLKLHLNTVHAKSSPVECTHCNKIFKSEYTLRKHEKIVAGEKLLNCELCSKEFTMAHVLRAHMVTHSDERPHCCDVCGVSYKLKAHLQVHMRKHTGHLPHKCAQCPKAFPTVTQLKRHNSVHTGKRAHSCPFCDRTFHSKQLKLAHCAVRHKNEIGEEKDLFFKDYLKK